VERGSEPFSPAVAASALQWWADAGVDVVVNEAPRNWLRPKAVAAPVPAARPAAPAAKKETLPDQLDLFQAYLRDSAALPYSAPAAPRVMPAGDPASGLMLITDMPGSEDAGEGRLVGGEAGRLLDRMLAAIGRDRGSVYLASLSCLRSPSGAFDRAGAEQCATLARHHIGLVTPKAVLVMGDAAAKALLGGGVIQTRGRWHEISTQKGQVRALATFAPTLLLDQPKAKRHAWADLQLLIEGLK
jgi:uracil-DNA glycosylase